MIIEKLRLLCSLKVWKSSLKYFLAKTIKPTFDKAIASYKKCITNVKTQDFLIGRTDFLIIIIESELVMFKMSCFSFILKLTMLLIKFLFF